MIRKAIIPVLLFATAVLSSAGKQKTFEGAITGVVSTEDGGAAPNFRVCTLEHREYGGIEQTQTCCLATTNRDGQLLLLRPHESQDEGNTFPHFDIVLRRHKC